MTAKPTVSLTDQGYALAKLLVESGKFASVSAVLQHGLRLVEREEDTHAAHLEAIRKDLEWRIRQPTMSEDEMDAAIDTMMAEKWLARLGTDGE
jgi:antitoxin ParD1/3/4